MKARAWSFTSTPSPAVAMEGEVEDNRRITKEAVMQVIIGEVGEEHRVANDLNNCESTLTMPSSI